MRRRLLLAILGLAASTLTVLAVSPPASPEACPETTKWENVTWSVPAANEYGRTHDAQTWQLVRAYEGDTSCEKSYRKGLYRRENAVILPAGSSNPNAVQILANRYCNGVETVSGAACTAGQVETYQIGRMQAGIVPDSTHPEIAQPIYLMEGKSYQFGVRAKLPAYQVVNKGGRVAFWTRNDEGTSCGAAGSGGGNDPEYAEIDLIEWYSWSERGEGTTHVCYTGGGATAERKMSTKDMEAGSDQNLASWHNYTINKVYNASTGNYRVVYRIDGNVVANNNGSGGASNAVPTHDCSNVALNLPFAVCKTQLHDPGWQVIIQSQVFNNESGDYVKPGIWFHRMTTTISDMWIKEIPNP